MTVKIVFNELSLNSPFRNKQVARSKMEGFIATLRTAIEKGAKRELCTRSDFDYLQLSLGYQIVQCGLYQKMISDAQLQMTR